MENKYHQKNLEFLLSFDEKELYYWLDNLPERHIEYVEWLIEYSEEKLDQYMLSNSDFKESKEILDKFITSK